MRHILLLALAFVLLPLDGSAGQPPSSTDTPVFVAYYWRAKPGKTADYEDYIKNTAEAIDESARRAGVFEEVRTVTPAAGTVSDWTHLRIFRLKNGGRAGAGGGPGRGDAARGAGRSEAEGQQRSLRGPSRSG